MTRSVLTSRTCEHHAGVARRMVKMLRCCERKPSYRTVRKPGCSPPRPVPPHCLRGTSESNWRDGVWGRREGRDGEMAS